MKVIKSFKDQSSNPISAEMINNSLRQTSADGIELSLISVNKYTSPLFYLKNLRQLITTNKLVFFTLGVWQEEQLEKHRQRIERFIDEMLEKYPNFVLRGQTSAVIQAFERYFNDKSIKSSVPHFYFEENHDYINRYTEFVEFYLNNPQHSIAGIHCGDDTIMNHRYDEDTLDVITQTNASDKLLISTSQPSRVRKLEKIYRQNIEY